MDFHVPETETWKVQSVIVSKASREQRARRGYVPKAKLGRTFQLQMILHTDWQNVRTRDTVTTIRVRVYAFRGLKVKRVRECRVV
jgi:hypothetical protein